MQVIDLKTQVESLVQLQQIDTQIYALRNEKEAKPKEVQALEVAFEEKKQHLQEFEKKSLDLQKEKKEQEIELASKEEGIKKLQTQLYQLKTNKEYQAMLKQIDDTKADISVVEDKILQLLDTMDKIKSDIDKEKKKLLEEEDELNEQRKIVQDRIEEIDDKLAQLEAKRKQITPAVDHKILLQYEKILSSRDSLAIVSVKNNSCQGCNMQVPPQVINLIKMYERLITCEICNRILYIDDEGT